MKTMKLNLLEKKEMNEVRGGEPWTPCSDASGKCKRVKINGVENWNTGDMVALAFEKKTSYDWDDRIFHWKEWKSDPFPTLP